MFCLIPAPLCLSFHTAQILIFDNEFTICTNFTISCSLILQFVCLWYIHYHIIYQRCWIYFIHGTINTGLNQQGRIVTDAIKYNLMNCLIIFTSCSFIRKFVDIQLLRYTNTEQYVQSFTDLYFGWCDGATTGSQVLSTMDVHA